MKTFLAELKKKAVLGVVGGSDYPKMEEQMGGEDCKCLFNTTRIYHHFIISPPHPPSSLTAVKDMYDYVFPENGLVAYHNGELFSKMVSL